MRKRALRTPQKQPPKKYFRIQLTDFTEEEEEEEEEEKWHGHCTSFGKVGVNKNRRSLMKYLYLLILTILVCAVSSQAQAGIVLDWGNTQFLKPPGMCTDGATKNDFNSGAMLPDCMFLIVPGTPEPIEICCEGNWGEVKECENGRWVETGSVVCDGKVTTK